MDKPFEERKEEFKQWLMVEYRQKMTDLGCDMYSYPLYIPDNQGGFRTVIQTDIVDVSNSPIKSPFSAS